jgi:osmotically-inducible protein OsmY
VEWIGEDEIRIEADRAALENLPEYHPALTDEQITAEVQARLATHEQTRGETAVAALTRDGVVRLSGVVHTEEAKRAAAAVAGAVAGVWEVENGLLVGRDLAQTVDEALAHDARTAQEVIESTYSDGCLTLRGQVRGAREKEAAVEIAQAIEGVTAVIDELEVQAGAKRRSGPAPSPDSLLAIASRLGMLKRY